MHLFGTSSPLQLSILHSSLVICGNFSKSVDFLQVVKLCIHKHVDRLGKCCCKLKLQSEVSSFYRVQMRLISCLIWCQIISPKAVTSFVIIIINVAILDLILTS